MSVSAAVIVGALSVGESVRHSLVGLALERLGLVTYALVAEGDYFSAELAGRMNTEFAGQAMGGGEGLHAVSLLILPGSAGVPGVRSRVGDVGIIGVGDGFGGLIPSGAGGYPGWEMPGDGLAVINSFLASRLGLKPGDDLVLRFSPPSSLPGDLPLLGKKDALLSVRLRVESIAPEGFPGDFSLRNSQTAVGNVFVCLDWLSRRAGIGGKANVILAASDSDAAMLDKILQSVWQPSDSGLEIKKKPDGSSELKSSKIFISDNIARKAIEISGVEGIMTYFVNSIRLASEPGEEHVGGAPYSFVAGVGEGDFKELLSSSEGAVGQAGTVDAIIINRWLADDLEASPGSMVEMKYYIPGPLRTLEERSRSFRVAGIVPMEGLAADSSLMPDFPGISDSARCSEWDASIPLDMSLIREKDEDYWRKYSGTPKAFINLAAAREMWGGQFGSLTAVRFPPESDLAGFEAKLEPLDFGLAFRNVRAGAVKAASSGVDFGGLFIGLSFFLLFSAFLLTVMIFLVGVNSRREEFFTLGAMGFAFREIRNMFMAEGAVLAVLGALVGIPLGTLYNMLVLYLLGSVWSGASGGLVVTPYASPVVYAAGASSAILVACAAMFFALARLAKKMRQPDVRNGRGQSFPAAINACLAISLAIFAIVVSTVLYLLLLSNPSEHQSIFFGLGALLLLAGWLFCRYALEWIARNSLLADRPSTFRLVLKNISYKPSRSMASLMLLSCGIFLTVAVALNRRYTADPSDLSSGTGGYSLFVRTSVPVPHDLGTEDGRKALGLDHNDLDGVEFVSMSLSEGDEASCLNLNHVERPAVLGVDFAKFANPPRFTFAAREEGFSGNDTWGALAKEAEKGAIPAVGDQDVIVWSMGKALGAYLELPDEQGRPRRLQLAGALQSSVFQGYVLVHEHSFREMFPSAGGAKCLLVQVPEGKEDIVKAHLADALADYGAEISTCSSRLERFYKVANTYLTIFLMIGGLGVMLGTAGFGALVLRDISERRFELAIMSATGFSRRQIIRLLVFEHSLLIADGTAIGLLCGLLSAIPAMLPPSHSAKSLPIVAAVSAMIVIAGVLSVLAAAANIVKTNTLKALRKE